MKLAFLAPEFLPTWGGVGIYSVELIKNLCKDKDMEIHVITPERGENYDKKKILKYFDNKIHIHNISKANDGFFYNFFFQYAVLRDFNKLNKKYKFDLVHAANLVHMPDIYLKFFKQNIPTITTIHTTLKSQSHIKGKKKFKGERSTVETLTSLAYPYIRTLEKIYLKRTKNFIAVSNWIKGFENNYGKNIEMIYNGIDIERFSPKDSNSKDFSYLDRKNEPIILYCGRLLALKGLKTLIESMKEVLKKKDAYFVFAGSGNIKKWEKLLEEKKISKDNYEFLGYVDYQRIQHLYNEADIFVLPSFTESFSLTLLEAMSSGLPVISTKVGGLPEMIKDNEDGILIDAGDSKQLTKSILNLLDNEKLRNLLSKNARKKIVDNFDSKIMAIKTKEFYEKIIEEDKHEGFASQST